MVKLVMVGESHESKNLAKVGPYIREKTRGKKFGLLIEDSFATRDQLERRETPLTALYSRFLAGYSPKMQKTIRRRQEEYRTKSIQNYCLDRSVIDRITGIENDFISGLLNLVELWVNEGKLKNLRGIKEVIEQVIERSQECLEKELLVQLLRSLDEIIKMADEKGSTIIGRWILMLRTKRRMKEIAESEKRSAIYFDNMQREIALLRPEILVTVTGAGHIPTILELSRPLEIRYEHGVQVVLTDDLSAFGIEGRIRELTEDRIPISYL